MPHFTRHALSVAGTALAASLLVACSGSGTQPLPEWTSTVLEPSAVSVAEAVGAMYDRVEDLDAETISLDPADCDVLVREIDRARTADRPADSAASQAWVEFLATAADLAETCASGDGRAFFDEVPGLAAALDDVMVSSGVGIDE